MSNDDERRSSPRVPFASPVTIRIGTISQECRARDIGTGGILLYFDGAPPELGAKLDIELRLGDASQLFIAGRVARYATGGNGIGVAFVELSPDARLKLSEYVATTL